MSKNSFITVKNLNKTFGSKKVIRNINFTVKKGESLVIIGGSGSGKSVLMKCIAGLLDPDKGSEIIMDNKDVTHLHTIKRGNLLRKFGMLFQHNALFDSLPIWHNICFNLINSGILNHKQAKEHAAEKMELVELDKDVLNLFPSELSGGMQKRVAIARAISTNPEIIFFDEPTSGLDPIISNTISDLIKVINKKLKSTTITITHDINVMEKIADKVALLKDGEIIWNDTVKNTIESKDEYIKLFLNKRSN
ncbi:MAG: phospholipid/cholesterol/gamma-HCH transport system ATP-binding protein [Candidatus Midichloriaceae bacterium]|jgi:phospholipid/cholesterol/gamma-HCH transport system ATP-binding protein